jgi:hypothetical protein
MSEIGRRQLSTKQEQGRLQFGNIPEEQQLHEAINILPFWFRGNI